MKCKTDCVEDKKILNNAQNVAKERIKTKSNILEIKGRKPGIESSMNRCQILKNEEIDEEDDDATTSDFSIEQNK